MKILKLWNPLRKRCSLSVIQNFILKNFSSHAFMPRFESKLVTMKIDTPYFRAIFTPEINVLVDLFKKHNYGLRIAGGAVRDLLMNKHPEDIDFATTATPDEMKKMFTLEGVRMFNRRGESHGTVTVRINDQQNFEITTLRIDMHTDGRHAEVEFTKDWELDAGRRDLTINAMFLGLDGTLYDYFNGKSDLEKRVVKFVGEPSSRIKEDYLRILRYFRFYGRISVEPDKHDAHTLEAIKENVGGLKDISGERLWMELKKVLQGNYAKEIMLRMIDVGIGPFIGLPETPNIEEFINVCNKCSALNPHSVTRLTAFLRTEDEVLSLHSRLKLSKYERDLALFLMNNKEDKNGDPPLHPYILLLFNAKAKSSDTHEWICEVFKYKGDTHLLKELNECKIPKFPVTGHMLMEKGFKQGPKMTNLLTALKSEWIKSNFQMTKEELLKLMDQL